MVNIINPVMMLQMLFYLTTVETSDNFFSFSVKQGEEIVPLSHYAEKVKFSSIHFRSPSASIDLYNILKCRYNLKKNQRKQSTTKQREQSTSDTFEQVLGEITFIVPLIIIKVLRILAASSYCTCIVTLLAIAFIFVNKGVVA